MVTGQSGCEKRWRKARWIRTVVNVEDHVTVPDIDPEAIENPEQFVEDYVGHITSIPLDTSRPLWDIHILNIKTSDAEAFVVIRSDHTLGDGVSLMSLILASTRKTSDPEALPSVPAAKRRERSVGYLGINRNWFLRLVLAIWSVIRMIWNTVEDVALFFATALFFKDTVTFLKYGADTGCNLKRFAHRIVAMDDIILIKKAMEMTVNDVLMGVTQATISCYLNRLHEKKNKEIGVAKDLKNPPGRIRLRATVPVNLRSESGIQPLADMMAKGSKCRWGNYVNFIILPFSSSLQKNPLDYLLEAKSAMDRKKHSLQAGLLYSVIAFIVDMFGLKVFTALLVRLMSNTTMTISNMVGPVEEISLYGHPISFIATTAYGNPQALTIHFQSYADKMTVSLAVDPTVIPDPHQLCDDFEESLKTIKAAVLERGMLKGVSQYHGLHDNSESV